MTAPGFCMLLRKHLQNGRITDITQPGLERIIQIHVEHLNELGDLCRKKLVMELMGKHSNLIFVNDGELIIDSIKHISGMVSSVREVLPGRPYFIPQTQEKENPLEADHDSFIRTITAKAAPVLRLSMDPTRAFLRPPPTHSVWKRESTGICPPQSFPSRRRETLFLKSCGDPLPEPWND